jgi:hypothetical protein
MPDIVVVDIQDWNYSCMDMINIVAAEKNQSE